MPHKNRKILKGVASDLKGRLLLVTLVFTGFVAQLAIIGPTSAPDDIVRDNEENISEQNQAANIAAQDRKKLKPLKVVPTSSPTNTQAGNGRGEDNNPSIQGGADTSVAGNNKNQKAQTNNSQKEPERTTQRCLLFNRILCN